MTAAEGTKAVHADKGGKAEVAVVIPAAEVKKAVEGERPKPRSGYQGGQGGGRGGYQGGRGAGGAGGRGAGGRGAGGKPFKKEKRSKQPRIPKDDMGPQVDWVPKTAIGKKVAAGEITDIDQILDSGKAVMEAGIVDKLLPGMNEEVINVRRVQRMLDSGRRMKFSILVVVGDKNGHVGVGLAKGVEAGPTIKKAITKAKLNIIKVPRGCSSWECGCGEPHTVPFKVTGKSGSVRITLIPAPKGVGLVVGDNSKTTLSFAGIKDVWVFTDGNSRTVINQVMALNNAFKRLSKVKLDVAKKSKDMSVSGKAESKN
jgi:small subunit ribosomal protein S5